MTYLEYKPSVRAQASPRRAAKWAAALALVVVLGLTLVSLQLFQLTSESVSRPALRQALNALVEGDAVIERNYEDLRARAEASQPGDTLELRDYPVAVPLTRDEVLASTPESLRVILLDRAVERMYDDGTGVLRDGTGNGAGRFTAAGLVDEFLSFLRSSVHGTLAVVTLILAGLSVVASIALIALCRGFGRIVAVGAVITVASLPVLVGGLITRAYAGTSSDSSEYLRSELMDVAESLSWIALRNGAALCAIGLVVLIAGVAAARLSGARQDAI
jgi:hypothetical protein